jgi:MoxR-like ATPase
MAQPSVPGVDPQVQAQTDAFRRDYKAVFDEISKLIVGHKEIIDGVLTCLFVGGHALLEGVPGLGKTALIRALAEALHLKFSRIQFTPDLMPADVIGTNVIMESESGSGGRHFTFMSGPIFAQIILADEINRATPKTQSALLEAMQEKQVTAGGELRRLEPPFFVMATQNRSSRRGTYPLPEAQLDRFFFKLIVQYSGRAELKEILDRTTAGTTPKINPVLDGRASSRINSSCAAW